MKKTFVIMGIALIAGAVVCVLLKKIKNGNSMAPKKDFANIPPDTNVPIINPNNFCGDSAELDNVKCSTISAVSARHEDASKIMKDAVGIICKRSVASEHENRELEEISNELDKLLSEE